MPAWPAVRIRSPAGGSRPVQCRAKPVRIPQTGIRVNKASNGQGKTAMANSLQEQLLKAGLVSEQKLKQTKTQKRKNKRQGGDEEALAQERRARQARAEKERRDRELNRERDEQARRKAEANALRQLIHDNRVRRERGDLAYNFTDGNALKRLYVNTEQHRGIVDGRLAIVRQDTFYELVTAQTAARVAERDPSLVLVLNRPGGGQETDDEYAEFQVPDDLMW